jgi:taurine dioxygenase
MVLQFMPLGEAAGVEVRGIDPREPVTGPDLETLLSAWRDNLVLLIRGTVLSDEELIAFARVFGALEPPGPNPYGAPFLPDFPELNVISNVVKDGQPIGGLGAGEAVWHADMTYRERPSKAAVLHAIEVPESGGDTYFSNMITAYETLPSGLKQRIGGRAAIHDAAHNSTGQLRKGYHETTDVSQTPGARHPLVRTDPDTGRKGLFLGRRPHSYIVGLEVAESEDLLDALWDHATQSRFSIAHQWRVADTLIWNNLCLLHRRDPFDDNAQRIMHRAQISGDHPVV